MRIRLVALCFVATACSPIAAVEQDSGAPSDAATADGGGSGGGGGGRDGGSADSGSGLDAGNADGGTTDGGTGDGGKPDGGGNPDGGDGGPTCSACSVYQPTPMDLATIGVSALNEISGLAVSRAHPGVVYAHNDSGGQPVVYAFSTAGAALGEFTLVGAVNRDWEDLSLGPCPTGTCVYVAEIGDNASAATSPYSVYRFAEPNVETTAPAGAQSVAAQRFELEYPGGSKHNAETLMVHPATGDVYVVTKTGIGQKSAAYKAAAPLSSTAPNPLVKVADLALPATGDLPLTGGDIHPCGTAVLLMGLHGGDGTSVPTELSLKCC